MPHGPFPNRVDDDIITGDFFNDLHAALENTYTADEMDDALAGKADAGSAHTHTNKAVLDSTTAAYTSAEKTKLGGVATGATANATDAALRDRATHTGSQPIASVDGLQAAIDAKAATAHAHAAADITSGTLADARIPNLSASKITSGSLPVSRGGTGTSTFTTGAFLRGNAANSITSATVATVKTDLGISNVDNTSDAAKPISTATQAALDTKSSTSHTHPELHTHANAAILNATTASFTAADETKLDAIESGADVTDTANVTAAGAMMASTISASGKGYVNHGASASAARPAGYASVEWVGSVEPANMANGDTWIIM